MAVRADLDLYNVLLGFGRLRERVELVRATLDPEFLLRARGALFPLPLVDHQRPVDATSSRSSGRGPSRASRAAASR